MDWHAAETGDVLRQLGSDAKAGLGTEEARRRLESHGFNELKTEGQVSMARIFLRQFKDVLIIILMIATALSAVVGELFDAALIALIVIFSAGLGFLQEYRAERAIEALKKMVAPLSRILRDGRTADMPSRELVPGDILLLEAGDRVAADARLVESISLKVDEASLTGESVSVEKRIERVEKTAAVAARRNMLFAGTAVTYGRGRAVVVATGMDTELGHIAEEVGHMESEPTPLEEKTREIGKWLGGICFGVCLLVAVLGITRQALRGSVNVDFVLTIVMFAVALAVAAVPEALTAIVTGTLAIGMREMAKKNALVRRMPAVETLGAVTVICSDKTGTITKGEMTAAALYCGGVQLSVTGVGYAPEGRVGEKDPPERFAPLFRAGILCNDARIIQADDRWIVKGDPTEAALIVLGTKAGVDREILDREYPRTGEIPFSSERKRMTTLHDQGSEGVLACMKGAPEVVLEVCAREGCDGELRRLDQLGRERLLSVAEEMASRGLRVLGLAERVLSRGETTAEEVEKDMVFLGLVGMWDPPREEAARAVRACRRVGIRPIMITGDHPSTAVAVAKEVDIFREGDEALTDRELNDLSDDVFAARVESVSVYARISPLNKLRIVQAWKRAGQIVAMTGDGVNDAPALKHADIGVAMGITGTEVSKEAADMILADDNFATIVAAIEQGRWIYDNIKKYLTYLLRANIVEVAVLGGVVILKGPESLPLLPAAILYINLVTDGFPALALGVAPPEPDLMERPPRDPRESVFSREVKAFIMLAFVVETPLFFWIYLREPDIVAARTELFLLFVIIELVIALNFRSLRFSIFRAPPHFWLVVSVGTSLAITAAVVRSPHVRESFGIGLPTLVGMEFVLVLMVAATFSIELVKLWLARTR